MPQAKNLDDGIGWKRLAKTLRVIEKLINTNDPVKGHGISINQTESGTIISTDPKTSDDAITSQISQAGGKCTLRLYDVSWFAAAVVDPKTCQQTFVQVLIQDPGGWADFHANLQPAGGTAPDTWV